MIIRLVSFDAKAMDSAKILGAIYPTFATCHVYSGKAANLITIQGESSEVLRVALKIEELEYVQEWIGFTDKSQSSRPLPSQGVVDELTKDT